MEVFNLLGNYRDIYNNLFYIDKNSSYDEFLFASFPCEILCLQVYLRG